MEKKILTKSWTFLLPGRAKTSHNEGPTWPFREVLIQFQRTITDERRGCLPALPSCCPDQNLISLIIEHARRVILLPSVEFIGRSMAGVIVFLGPDDTPGNTGHGLVATDSITDCSRWNLSVLLKGDALTWFLSELFRCDLCCPLGWKGLRMQTLLLLFDKATEGRAIDRVIMSVPFGICVCIHPQIHTPSHTIPLVYIYIYIYKPIKTPRKAHGRKLGRQNLLVFGLSYFLFFIYIYKWVGGLFCVRTCCWIW